MAFNSFAYFLFIPSVYLVFFLAADRWRWLVLLAASYCFYAAMRAPHLLAVLFVVTCISFFCGRSIAGQTNETIRTRWLWIGCFACVAMLCLLKYLPVLELGANNILGFNATLPRAIISIGVSYFTFQAISYMVDIYLEVGEPEHHFGHYALYMSFFPKLPQGPIERAQDFLPQLQKPYRFSYDIMRSSVLLFAAGFFKKVVIADRLALYADQVFNNVHDYTGIYLLLGIYAYALQIYFDFAGYTDMARGVARLFGINLVKNFDSPYLSTSIVDFWRRWHISFSRWILDYIFRPLQMRWRSRGQIGTVLALLITFFISGIWHGAAWGFVIWGLLHGIYLSAAVFYKPYKTRLHKWLGAEKRNWLKFWQVSVTFNMVCFAWVFFRAANLSDAWYVVTHLLAPSRWSQTGTGSVPLELASRESIIIIACSLVITVVVNLLGRHKEISERVFGLPAGIRILLYYGIIMYVLLFGYFSDQSFYYARF